MLKYRVITALILAPVMITAVLFLPTHLLAVVLALFIMLAAREWAGLSGIDSGSGQLIYCSALLLIMFGTFYLLPPEGHFGVIALSVLWWLVTLFRLVRYQNDGPPSSGLDPWRVFLPVESCLVASRAPGGPGPGR